MSRLAVLQSIVFSLTLWLNSSEACAGQPEALPPRPDLFDPPDGLTIPAKQLLAELGIYTGRECVPYTQRFCLDVAVNCYLQRRYKDSLAFAKQSIEFEATAAAVFIRALNELALGMCDDAQVSAALLKTLIPLDRGYYRVLRERFSSPRLVRLDLLIEAL